MPDPDNKNTVIVHELKETDILLGRGKRTNNRPGNTRFRELAEAQSQVYSSAKTKQAKRTIARQFVKEIESTGARFLRPVSISYEGSYKTAYEVVDKETIEIKVKQLMRDRSAVVNHRNAETNQDKSSLNGSAGLATSQLFRGGPGLSTLNNNLLPLQANNAFGGGSGGMPANMMLLQELAFQERVFQLQLLQNLQAAGRTGFMQGPGMFPPQSGLLNNQALNGSLSAVAPGPLPNSPAAEPSGDGAPERRRKEREDDTEEETTPSENKRAKKEDLVV